MFPLGWHFRLGRLRRSQPRAWVSGPADGVSSRGADARPTPLHVRCILPHCKHSAPLRTPCLLHPVHRACLLTWGHCGSSYGSLVPFASCSEGASQLYCCVRACLRHCLSVVWQVLLLLGGVSAAQSLGIVSSACCSCSALGQLLLATASRFLPQGSSARVGAGQGKRRGALLLPPFPAMAGKRGGGCLPPVAWSLMSTKPLQKSVPRHPSRRLRWPRF